MGWRRAAGGVLVVVALMPSAVAAQDSAEVAEMYGKVERAHEAGSWKTARSSLLGMLEAYPQDAYLMARADELAEMLQTCTFESSYKVPDMQEFFAGQVKSFKDRSGEIEIRYSQDKGAEGSLDLPSRDFEFRGNRHQFRVPFTGPHQIEITGVMPAYGEMDRQPEIIACERAAGHVRFLFTWPTRKGPGKRVDIWSIGSVFVSSQGQEAKVEDSKKPGLKFSLMHGEKYDLKVSAKDSSVVATIHGIAFLSVDKPKGEYGKLKFGWCPNMEEVVIKGILDPDWIRQQLESHRAARWAQFQADYDVETELPAWLFDEPQEEDASEQQIPAWHAMQAAGPPDADPTQDDRNAWAPHDEQMPEPQWIELTYARPDHITAVQVFEVCSPGALAEVYSRDERGTLRLLWSGSSPETHEGPFEITFERTKYRVQSLKLVLDTQRVEGWNEIDAVKLTGEGGEQWAVAAKASSSFADR